MSLGNWLEALQKDANIPEDLPSIAASVSGAVGALFEAERASSESDGRACVRRAMGTLSQIMALLQDARSEHSGVQLATRTLAEVMGQLYPIAQAPSIRPQATALPAAEQVRAVPPAAQQPTQDPQRATLGGEREHPEANVGAGALKLASGWLARAQAGLGKVRIPPNGSGVIDIPNGSGVTMNDILNRHREKIGAVIDGIHLDRKLGLSWHYEDDLVRDCLRELMTGEGALEQAPQSYERGKYWKPRIATNRPWNEVAEQIRKQVQTRLSELKATEATRVKKEWEERLVKDQEQRDKEAIAVQQDIDGLLQRHSPLIERFLEIAFRKVSARDEYGDENWDALEAEIKTLIRKVSKSDNLKFTAKGDSRLRAVLSGRFRTYHGERHLAVAQDDADISKMSGVEFEQYLASRFTKEGFSVQHTAVTGDQGADLIATKGSRRLAVQAKRWSGSVGNGAVQEVIAAMKFYDATEAWLVTNSGFTDAARILANKCSVRLVDGSELQRLGSLLLA